VAIPQAPDYRGETEPRADERITRYETVVGEHPTRAGLANILGSLAYGMADTPRVEQIRNGMDYFRAERQGSGWSATGSPPCARRTPGSR